MWDNNMNPDKWEVHEQEYLEMLLFNFNDEKEETAA